MGNPRQRINCRLAELRDRSGLTQKQLADRAGVSIGTVCEVEAGGGTYLRSALRIAAALGAAVEEIWPEKDTQERGVIE